MNRELGSIGAEVLGLFPALGHLRQQAGQQGAMDGLELGRLAAGLQRQLSLDHFHDLAVHVLPFGQAQVGEKVFLAPGAQLGARQVFALLVPDAPDLEQRQEVRLLVAQRRVFLVRLGLLVRRPVARIRNRERGCDDRHLVETLFLRARQQDAAESRVQR